MKKILNNVMHRHGHMESVLHKRVKKELDKFHKNHTPVKKFRCLSALYAHNCHMQFLCSLQLDINEIMSKIRRDGDKIMSHVKNHLSKKKFMDFINAKTRDLVRRRS